MSPDVRAQAIAAAEALRFKRLDAGAAIHPSAAFLYDGESFLDLWFEEGELRGVTLNTYLEATGPGVVWTVASQPPHTYRPSVLLARAIGAVFFRLMPGSLRPLPLEGLASIPTIIAAHRERAHANSAPRHVFGGDLLEERFALERAREDEAERTLRD